MVGNISCEAFEYKAIVYAKTIQDAGQLAEDDLRKRLGGLNGEFRVVQCRELDLSEETVLMGKVIG
jgi:hypothetical protein